MLREEGVRLTEIKKHLYRREALKTGHARQGRQGTRHRTESRKRKGKKGIKKMRPLAAERIRDVLVHFSPSWQLLKSVQC